MNTQQIYDVFLSHSHEDAEIVEEIARRLEDQAGFRVWLDKWVLVPGEEWQHDMAQGIADAKSCAICIGSSTPKGWFDQEKQRALNRSVSDKSFRVIPVLLPGADPGFVDQFLELRTWVDFRDGLEDDQAFHLLIAGIEGKSPGRFDKKPTRKTPKDTKPDDKEFHPLTLTNIRKITCYHTIEHEEKILSIAISPDGKFIAASGGKTIYFLNAASMEPIYEVVESLGSFLGYGEYLISSIAFSPNGREFAYSGGWTIYTREIESKEITNKVKRKWIATLLSTPSGANCVKYSPNGQLLASGWEDKAIYLWHVLEKSEVTTLLGHTEAVNTICFNPSGDVLASGSDDKTIYIWDIKQKVKIAILGEHQWGINSISFSPDGQQIAAASGWSIHLWDPRTRRKSAKLDGHEGVVKDIAFHPNEKLLTSASKDNTIRLWNTETFSQVTQLKQHDACVNRVLFSPSGRFMVSAGDDKKIRVWGVKH